MRLIIAHNEEMYREGVKSVLAGFDRVTVVGEAFSATTLLELLARMAADAVLLDLSISPGTGPRIVERLLDLAPDLRVVLVIALDDLASVRQAIELGVHACLLNGTGSDELITALRMVADDRRYLQAELVNALVDQSLESASRAGAGLSPDQQRMIQLVADGLSNKQLARELGISETAVKSSLRVIYSKLEASSRAYAVAVALRLGIVE